MLEVSWFVCNSLYFILYCYLFCNLVCKKKFEFNKNIFIFSLLIGLLYFTLTKLDLVYIRPYFIHLYCLIALTTLYKQSFVKTLIGLFIMLFLLTISELICSFILAIILGQYSMSLSSNPIFTFSINMIIFLFSLILSKINIIKKISNSIIEWYNENEKKFTIFIFLAFLIVITFVLYNNFIKVLPSSLLIVTNLFCIGVFVFVLGYFKEKTNNNRITSEYERLLNYVKVYEQTIDEKSKKQHEYKNQLILISGMVKTKKVKNYINDLINEEQDDKNVELIRRIQYLPQGGLKGLIYYKVEEMIDRGIDVYVDISPKLEDKKVKKVIKDNLHDISKIIGVYLDNAIEAVNEADKKYIVIDAIVEKGNIIFSFSNTYKGCVNLSKLDKEGYTTKGNGKGYGLSLVKDIINRKKDVFSSERQVNGPYYVQKLYIKK